MLAQKSVSGGAGRGVGVTIGGVGGLRGMVLRRTGLCFQPRNHAIKGSVAETIKIAMLDMLFLLFWRRACRVARRGRVYWGLRSPPK